MVYIDTHQYCYNTVLLGGHLCASWCMSTGHFLRYSLDYVIFGLYIQGQRHRDGRGSGIGTAGAAMAAPLFS